MLPILSSRALANMPFEGYSIRQCIIAILISFLISFILCPIFIPILHRIKFGQNVRDDGPKSHLVKAGTPTMGGIMILIAFLGGGLFYIKGNLDCAMVMLITFLYGVIGFIDDYIKVVKKRSLGLRAYQKIIMQVIITGIFAYYILEVSDVGAWFVPFLFLVMVGTVNSVNLTDGLDGLAAGVTVLVAVFFFCVSYVVDSYATLSPICGCAVGALLGFLLFNSHPAKVFMGDTGSLALGGFVASVAVLMKMPLFLLIVGLIYVCESLSVIIQVVYFKISGGKRIFKMAPIHHHFELSGFKETQVVAMFYIITAILCLIGFLGI